MNFLQKGTPYIYQGQEIGMTNIVITDINDYDDVEVHGFYNEYVVKNKVMTYEEFLDGCNKEARDNNRTPMQWDTTINAGFNTGTKTWLKVNPNYTEINVESALADPNSVLHYYRKLLALRKSEEYKEVFVYGKYDSVFEDKKNVYIYTRRIPNKKVCVVTNMRDQVEHVVLPFEIKKVLLANYEKEYTTNKLTLSPFETVVFEVE
jgi:glycosidase